MLKKSELVNLLVEFNISPSKALGQNFMVDQNCVRKIVNLAQIKEGDNVIEIGGGAGVLTEGLLETKAQVSVLEFDRKLVELLKSRSELSDATIVHGDAMTFNFDLLKKGNSGTKVVSNLPYNIASPLIIRILEDFKFISPIVVLVQKEIGRRMVAKVGENDYGLLSTKIACLGTSKILSLFSPEIFYPRPKVESALIEIVRSKSEEIDLDEEYWGVKTLINTAYSSKRKMLKSTLGKQFGEEVFISSNVDWQKRPEELTVDDFVAILRAVRKYNR